MAGAMWIIVFISVLSEAEMQPLPPPTSLPMSVYDICSTTDVHQIEELRKTLFEDFNRSSTILDENTSSSSFGLLEEDWKRLRQLENRIPEGSVLKSKVLVVFRILIAALYQSHGMNFEHVIGQDNSIFSFEDRNSIEYEETISSRELEFGQSTNDNVILHDLDFNNRTSTTNNVSHKNLENTFNATATSTGSLGNEQRADHMEGSESLIDEVMVANIEEEKEIGADTYSNRITNTDSKYHVNSNEVTNSLFNAFDEDLNEKRMLENHTNSNEYSTKSNTPGTVSMQNEYKDNVKSSYSGEQHTMKVNNVFGKSEDSTTTMAVTFDATKDDRNNDDGEGRINNVIKYPEIVRGYNGEKMTVTSTERSYLQQIIDEVFSEHSSTEHETSSVINTEPLIDSKTTYNTFANNHEEFIASTKSLVDQSEHPLYPELIDLVIDRNDDIEDFLLKSHEDTLNISTTKGSVETNQIFDDIEGSDSFIKEVKVPIKEEENELKSTTHGDLISYYPIDYYSTHDPNETKWQLKKSTPHVHLENSNVFYELTTKSPNEFSTDIYKNSNITRTIIINDSSDEHTPPRDNFNGFSETVASVMPVDVLSSTVAENLFIRPTKPETTPSLKETPSKHKHGESREDIQSISVEIIDPRPTNNVGANPTEDTIPESSTNVVNSENDDLQGSRIDERVFSSEKLDELGISVPSFPESLENIPSAENVNLPSSQEETSVNSLNNNNISRLSEEYSTETPKHVLSVQYESLQSSIDRKPLSGLNNNRYVSPAVQFDPESTVRISNVENGNFQSSSGVTRKINPTYDDGLNPVVRYILESSELVSSIEKDELEKVYDENQDLLIPTNNDGGYPTTQLIHKSLERMSSEENGNVQESSIETSTFGTTKNDGASADVLYASESSDFVASAENNNPQSRLDDKIISSYSQIGDLSTVKSITDFFKHQPSAENNPFQGSNVEISIYNPTYADESSLIDEPLPESSELISSLENFSLHTSIDGKDIGKSTNYDGERFDTHIPLENSQYISSSENANFRISSVEKNTDGIEPSTQSTSENSKYMSILENKNVRSNSVERNEDGGAQPNAQSTHDNSEYMSSSENDNFRSSSVERNVDGEKARAESTHDNSEYLSSTENENVPNVNKFHSMDDYTPKMPLYPKSKNLEGSNVHSTDDLENKDNNDQISSIKVITLFPPNSDEALPVTIQAEDSYRTFHKFYSKPFNSPLPTKSDDEFTMYPTTSSYLHENTNVKSRRRCRNGNDCVHVQHIEYKWNDDKSSAELSKRVYSRFKSKESSENK